VIEINDLYKYYGQRRAIGPLSFTIEAGEVVGLLGLNGAGKTTTLRILACDLLPSSGSVRVDGIDVVDRPHDVRARIGYLPDAPPLYAEMTVHDYLRFAASLRGMARADLERRVPEVEELTQIRDVAGEPITSLSHGYRQRVGIAQAVVHKPRLLVLDEPITGLDPVQIVEMRELLRSLKGEHTIVLSSHILPEIRETCDRILMIMGGEIVASGSETELSSRFDARMRVEITVRAAGEGDGSPAERAAAVARGIEGVTMVEVLAPAEPGPGIVTLRVQGDDEIREALSPAFQREGYALLALRRSERDLEAMFLKLARVGDEDADARAALPDASLAPRAGAGQGATSKAKANKKSAGAVKASGAAAKEASADPSEAEGEGKDGKE
jgi:ABC-2 type transport system ATP-binding protein